MKRGAWIAVAAGIVIVAVGAVALWPRSQPSAEAGPSPSVSVTPSVAPSPAPLPAVTQDPEGPAVDSETMLAPFVAAESASREDPQTPLQFADIATGAALSDLKVNALQFATDGLTQVGSPTVVSASVVSEDAAANPPTTTILACLDYSGVDVIGADGQSVKSADAPQRVPTLFTLAHIENRWLVSERSFPDESSC